VFRYLVKARFRQSGGITHFTFGRTGKIYLFLDGEWYWLANNENNRRLVSQKLSRYGTVPTRDYPEDGTSPLDCLGAIDDSDGKTILKAYGIREEVMVRALLPRVFSMEPYELENIGKVYSS
jgi:hypothetical protein